MHRMRHAPFALRNQILSAALSVPANIAEANRRDRKAGEAEQLAVMHRRRTQPPAKDP
jgi:four helix bundle protein